MCGRYIFYDGSDPYILSLIMMAEESYEPSLFSQLKLDDVWPGSLALTALMTNRNAPAVRPMTWGIQGFDNKLIINARSETFAEKRMFRDMYACVIPASAYYETSKERVRYSFTCAERPLFMAGLCRKEEDGLRFVILTEQAPYPQAEVHERQPVIFTKDDAVIWMKTKKQALVTDRSLHERILYQKSA